LRVIPSVQGIETLWLVSVRTIGDLAARQVEGRRQAERRLTPLLGVRQWENRQLLSWGSGIRCVGYVGC
jgi:hypothetical protein